MNALFLIVSIDGNRVAFRAADIQSVVELEELTPVPGTSPHIIGLSALRSQPMTVIDCALSLGKESGRRSSGKAVVVQQGEHLFALKVDEVDDVISLEEQVEPIPSELSSGWQRVAAGMIRMEEGMVLLADADGFIEGPQKEAA